MANNDSIMKSVWKLLNYINTVELFNL